MPEIKKFGDREMYWEHGEKESNLKDFNISMIHNAIRKMSVNSLYRD